MLKLVLVSGFFHSLSLLPHMASSYSTENVISRQAKQHGKELRALLLPREDTTGVADAHLVFPGGGIFFYWQAGVVCYLREQGYDLSACTFSGASAGALTATLTTADVDFYEATELALKMSSEYGVWDRSGGLQGIWGPLIRDWLDMLLPPSIETIEGRLSLLVTPIPSFGKTKVSTFAGRDELIDCNMASIHLVRFMKTNIEFCDLSCLLLKLITIFWRILFPSGLFVSLGFWMES
jgi:hypothetical protein